MQRLRLIIGMSYAILRLSKLKSWSAVGGSGAHTYRATETPNADPALAGLNVTGIGTKGDVLGDVRRRVDAITSKPRSNAVLALELLLTASPEHFQGKSQADVKAWARANATWLKQTFGKDNVVHLVLHQDESTPHLVAYVTPERDGRLNARAITGTPEMLSQMQTSYADAMAVFSLERGMPGSKAKHQTVRDWYGHLNAAAVAGEKRIDAVEDPTPPPSLPLWTLPEARQAAVTAWQGVEKGKRREIVQQAARDALAASDAQYEAEGLKHENSKLTTEVISLRRQLTAAYEAMELGKEAVAALRKSNTTLVAQRLGHAGAVLPKENAIDLLKRIAGFDYGQAVAWLHAEFGPVVTGAVVSGAVEQADPPRPFTKAENVIKRGVYTQLDALDAERYRLTLMSYDASQKPFLPGKRRGTEEEHFYTRDEVVALIPWLRFQNNQGMNILVTPMDDTAHYVLLDDAKLSVEDLQRAGFQPCIVQQSSWKSHQVVFKVPRTMDREAVLAVFNELNRVHGDAEITGLRHPFRLPGFRNMKPKHLKDGLYPFVRVLSAVNTMCQRCMHLVRRVEAKQVVNISTGPKYSS